MAEADAEINIDNDGSVHIYSNNGESLKRPPRSHLPATEEIGCIAEQFPIQARSLLLLGLRPAGWCFPLKAPRERATMPSVLLASSVFSRVISCASMLTVNTSIAIEFREQKRRVAGACISTTGVGIWGSIQA